MRRLPAQIDIPSSQAEITEEVKKLLRAAAVGRRLPTPRDDILACAQLVEASELDLSAYEESFRNKAAGFLHQAVSKVLGFLDRRGKEVYVDPTVHPRRRNFITYHEITHKILTWQQVIYTEDEEATLSLECRDMFESEANFGAAEILFQCERFEEQARDYNVSIASALHLADEYHASRHASLRRFVERSNRPCLLMVLKPTALQHEDGLQSYFVSYAIPSPLFFVQFGEPFSKRFLDPGDDLREIVGSRSEGEITLFDLKGVKHDCTVEVFDNTHRIFALIYPKKLPRTRTTALFTTN